LAGWQLEIRDEEAGGAGHAACGIGALQAGALQADAPAGALRISNIGAAEAYVRSLPASFADSVLSLYLDGGFNLLAVDQLGPGRASDCGLKPMQLIGRGERLGAVAFILVTYAPGRVAKASPEESRITREIRRAGEDVDIHLLDHLIVGRGGLIEVAA